MQAGFIRDGYVPIRGAVDAETVTACRELIWESMAGRGVRREDPATWPPLAEIDDLGAGPFVAAGMSPALTAAYNELIGRGRWNPPVDAGNAVVVRFPSEDRANAGYHIEGSYPGPAGQRWWVNIHLRARGLLALFLFTDVEPQDAPTRLMRGSALAVPEFLVPYGAQGTDADAEFWRPSALCLPVAHATGSAGDVFLCHPFIVHTATWPHRGAGSRMIAQPAVHAADGFAVDGSAARQPAGQHTEPRLDDIQPGSVLGRSTCTDGTGRCRRGAHCTRFQGNPVYEPVHESLHVLANAEYATSSSVASALTGSRAGFPPAMRAGAPSSDHSRGRRCVRSRR